MPRSASAAVALAALSLLGCDPDDEPAEQLLGAGHDIEPPDRGMGRLELADETFDFELDACRLDVVMAEGGGRELSLLLGGHGEREDGRGYGVGANRTATDYPGTASTFELESINILIAAEPGADVDGDPPPAKLSFSRSGTLEDRTQGEQPALRASEDGLITARDVELEMERDAPGLDGLAGHQASLVALCNADDVRFEG